MIWQLVVGSILILISIVIEVGEHYIIRQLQITKRGYQGEATCRTTFFIPFYFRIVRQCHEQVEQAVVI